jgi:hypothetical protein
MTLQVKEVLMQLFMFNAINVAAILAYLNVMELVYSVNDAFVNCKETLNGIYILVLIGVNLVLLFKSLKKEDKQ